MTHTHCTPQPEADDEHVQQDKQEKKEQRNAKRRAQAAARRERKVAQHDADAAPRKSKLSSEWPSPALYERNDPAAFDYGPPMLIPGAGTPAAGDAATPDMREGSERIPSPAPTVASSIDAQLAGLAGYNDSAYNTEYEDGDLAGHDGGAETDGDIGMEDAETREFIEDAIS